MPLPNRRRKSHRSRQQQRRVWFELLEDRRVLALFAPLAELDQTGAIDTPPSQTLPVDVAFDGARNSVAARENSLGFDPSLFVPMPLPDSSAGGSTSDRGRPVSYNVVTAEQSFDDEPQGPYPAHDEVEGGAGLGFALSSEANSSSFEGDFSSLSVVDNPELFPWRVNAKLFLTFPSNNTFVCSGTLIDPLHVLTAGHCVHSVAEGGWATTVTAVPAYENGAQPFGSATSTELHSYSGWVNNQDFDDDVGIVDLDRPIGALTDWHGYGYNDDPAFYTGNTFHNPGYPAASPYDGQEMYYWFGDFDYAEYSGGWFGNEVGINSESFGGQSGSGAYYINPSDNRIVYGVLSNGSSTQTNFPRLTSGKFTNIRDMVIADDTPSTFDLIPLTVQASPSGNAGGQLSSLSYVVHNYSTASFSGTVNVDVYLSTNSNISTSDTLLQTRSFTQTIDATSTVAFTATSSLPTIPENIAAGDYWIGVILDITDADTDNNDSDGQDASPISIDASQPDLEPYQPTGWDDTLVISTQTGTSTTSSTIYDDEDIYVDYSVVNSGGTAAGAFRYGLYLDGELRKFVDRSSLDANTFSQVLDSSFSPLAAGLHTFEVRADYNSQVAESNESNNSYLRNFVVTPRATTGDITGAKWEDLDGDGIRDAGESGLPGWTIYLDQNTNGQLDNGETSTVTDANGNYSFLDLTPDTYTVAEVQQSGWIQTAPVAPAADSDSQQAAPRLEPSPNSGGKTGTMFQSSVNDSPQFPQGWQGDFVGDAPQGGPGDPLTVILDFNDPGQPNTMDGLGNVVGDFDVTAYGFASGDFGVVANAVLDLVSLHYQDIADSNEFAPSPLSPGEQLDIEFEIGNIGTPPANGSNDYYYLQIGEGISGQCIGALGCASLSSIRNSGGSAGAAVGSVVGSIFTDAINGLGGLSPSNALTSGNLVFTANAIGGTTTHEAGHALSLAHLDKAGSVTPHSLPPIMGTGAIDLPNQNRIDDREFAYSGFNQQAGGAQQFHLNQLVGALGVTQSGAGSAAVPGDGIWTVTLQAGNVFSDLDFGNQPLAEIHGTKWNDENGDGLQNAGESSLPGWTIYLDFNTNGQLDGNEPSTVTDASGDYQFIDLVPGDYIVAEVQQTGWNQTFPPPLPPDNSSGDSSGVQFTTDASHTDQDEFAYGERLGDEFPQTQQSLPVINMTPFRSAYPGIDGSGFSVVIIDTGIDLDHPFFGPDNDSNGVADRIAFQFDFFGSNDADASDFSGHGSNVASIALSSDATIGGVAPGADIIALKVFPDGSGGAPTVDTEEALQWVVNNAATFNIASVNLSLGGGNNGSATVDARSDEFAALAGLDVLVAAASGNGFFTVGSVPGVSAPSSDANVLSVGATFDSNIGPTSYASGAEAFSSGADRVAPFSQRHATLSDIFAPGAAITGADFDGTTATYHGTSQASPHIAGVIALAQQLAMQEVGRRLTLAEMRSLFQSTSVTIVDGGDEDDNVTNTGLSFSRIDMLALGNAIASMGGLAVTQGDRVWIVENLGAGDVVQDLDFGNQQVSLNQFVVNSTDDTPDAAAGDGNCNDGSGQCTLRAAIQETNSLANAGGPDQIVFNIPGAGTHTIALQSPLPTITQPVAIDGTTEPGYASTPLIELDGTLAGGGANGITLVAGSSTIAGLAINRFAGSGILLAGAGGNMLQQNHIGTSTSGNVDLGNGAHGVIVFNSPNNMIGGNAAADGNVISGNTVHGVYITRSAATGNHVKSNIIGLGFNGSTALGNNGAGVRIDQGASSNQIGGSGNVISGNATDGVRIVGASSSGNTLAGNKIGTDISGLLNRGNGANGVAVESAANNSVGVAGDGNLISGNLRDGIFISGTTATGNLVRANTIGLNSAGTAMLANSETGINLFDAPSNTIGGTAAGAGNTISGNGTTGVFIAGTNATNNRLEGNEVGTNPSGTAAMGNASFGVVIRDASNNTVGGSVASARNIVSANGEHGVAIIGTTASGNVISGNLIGTDASGTVDLGNTQTGVLIFRAPSNRIGGTTLAERNVISGNDLFGIKITSANATGNIVQGNYVGTDSSGTNPLPNSDSGIHLANAQNSTIGGLTAAARNVISGNGNHGVVLVGAGVANNLVQGNFIGTTASGNAGLGNLRAGVQVQGGAHDNTIGGSVAGAGNVISANGTVGLGLSNAGTSNNTVSGNFIGTNSTGSADLGNQSSGIAVVESDNNMIGGATLAERNVISGNGLFGVLLSGASAAGNQVVGNFIGTDASGTVDLGNTSSGVFLAAPNNSIGGSAAGTANLISGNDFVGIRINGAAATGNQILGNLIGTRADGTSPLGNTGIGVRIDGASNNTIGGTAVGSGNVIAHQSSHGIAVIGNATGNAIRANSTFFNNGLGIDLNADGATSNDTALGDEDADAGPNNRQNFPVLTSAVVGASLVVNYSVPSATNNSAYALTIDFFVADSTGLEGRIYLGSDVVTAGGAMNPQQATISAGAANVGAQIVATATDANGNTSEFSLPVTATAGSSGEQGNPSSSAESRSAEGSSAESSSAEGEAGTREGERNRESQREGQGVRSSDILMIADAKGFDFAVRVELSATPAQAWNLRNSLQFVSDNALESRVARIQPPAAGDENGRYDPLPDTRAIALRELEEEEAHELLDDDLLDELLTPRLHFLHSLGT